MTSPPPLPCPAGRWRVVVSCLALAAALGCRPATEPRPRTNLVLVCLDTVRYDVFWEPENGGMRDSLLDRTRSALRFDHAQSSAPWTIPAVASVFTGLYPARHGAGRFSDEVANLDKQTPSALGTGFPTLAEVLSQRGYRTRGIAAHPWLRPKFGLDRGFERMELIQGHAQIQHRADFWLGTVADSGAPFFLYLHLMEAHQKHMVDEEVLAERVAKLPRALRDQARRLAPAGICGDPQASLCSRFQLYSAAVREEREAVATLLDDLAARHLLERTIVVVFADHGEEFQDHARLEPELGESPRGFYGFGHGQSLFQELLHVPLVVWLPGVAGRAIDEPVSLVDLMPTLLGWLGDPLPGAVWDGIALPRSLALGRPLDTRLASRPLYSSGIAYGPPQYSVLAGRRKRIDVPDRHMSLAYDLAADPGERKPHAGSSGRQALAAALAAYERLFGLGVGPRPRLSPAETAQLRALGYLGGSQRPTGVSSE